MGKWSALIRSARDGPPLPKLPKLPKSTSGVSFGDFGNFGIGGPSPENAPEPAPPPSPWGDLSTFDADDVAAVIDERAAILEYEGGFDRVEAERLAREEVASWMRRG